MTAGATLPVSRKLVLVCAAALFLSWAYANFDLLVHTQNGLVRFSLTAALALLMVRRPRPVSPPRGIPGFVIPLAVAGGVSLGVTGIVLGIRQFEWLGILLVLAGCLRWALPRERSRDIPPALFLLYWAHPLPSRVFLPLQLAMQRASVRGSEWLLHAMNVRVWADGLVLRTGLNTFEVPAWCSGMRTATTVFILALGLGFFVRLRWYDGAALILAALAQALALNVFRISAMVALVPAAGSGAGVEFLHHTTGAVAVAAVAIVCVELSLTQTFRRRRWLYLQELNPDGFRMLSEKPFSLHRLIRYRWAIFLALVAAVTIMQLTIRTETRHRAEMIKDVAIALRDTGKLEHAQRAADAVRRMVPGDTVWELATTRLLLIRGKYNQVLASLDNIPDEGEAQVLHKNILRAYSYMGLDRLADAATIVGSMPEHARRTDPRVNMILAEMGVYGNDPDEVATSVVVASRWAPNASRVRAIYPYLRRRRRWHAIVDSDIRSPFAVPEQAFAAVEAYMNLNRPAAVARITLAAVNTWPSDHRVMQPLFFMAMRRERAWEERFAAHLCRSLPVMESPDDLYNAAGKCFKLIRPDLAWSVYRRLAEVDADHPYLALLVARYGRAWFTFRKRRVGIQATTATESIDLKAHFVLSRSFKGWEGMYGSVPLAGQLGVDDSVPVRKKYLEAARAEFGRRDEQDSLSLNMKYAYINVLEISGDIPAAKKRLELIARNHPRQKARTRVVLSEIYERKADWQNVYETLRTYPDEEQPDLMPMVRLCTAQLKLKMGLAAIHTARRTVHLFPSSTQAAQALGTALNAHGSPEEALFAISRPRPRRQMELDIVEAKALYLTERYNILEDFTRSALLPRLDRPPGATQHLFLPPANLSLLWHRVFVPSGREFAENAARLEVALEGASVPFLRDMMTLWLEAHRSKCAGDTAEPARWRACGRDPVEKATALNQLTLLLCWQGRYAEARAAAEAAVTEFPECPLLWRILTSLSGGDKDVVARACEACPGDPEIWLANLVTRTAALASPGDVEEREAAKTDRATNTTAMAEETMEWLAREITAAAADDTFSPATMARAGDLLFRLRARDIAAVAARDAIERARGLLPVYVLGIRCALAAQDVKWAVETTRLAIGASLRPPPILYEKLVDLKSIDDRIDTDREMVEALRNLRTDDPDNLRWAQTLGYVRFKRGGWEIIDALYQMTVAMDGGATNRTPYVIAAEASRLLGNVERAADFLRRGLQYHPDDLGIMNNLVYTLSFNPETLDEALGLLPEVLARATNDIQVLDTATVVYLRAGQLDKAERTIPGLLDKSEPGSLPWFRARMYLAAIALKRHRPEEANEILKGILRHSRQIPDEDVLAASRLLSETEDQ